MFLLCFLLNTCNILGVSKESLTGSLHERSEPHTRGERMSIGIAAFGDAVTM